MFLGRLICQVDLYVAVYGTKKLLSSSDQTMEIDINNVFEVKFTTTLTSPTPQINT